MLFKDKEGLSVNLPCDLGEENFKCFLQILSKLRTSLKDCYLVVEKVAQE